MIWCGGSCTFHHAAAAQAPRYKDAIAASTLRFARSGSGHLDWEIIEQLEGIFGVPVIQTCSMTEAGRLTGNPLPPRIRKKGTVGITAGGEIAVMGPDGSFLPTGAHGEIVARGPHVFEGYENDPEANAIAFVDGWFRTGDDDFFVLDGDSLQAVELFLRIEREIGTRLPRSALFEAATVAKMAEPIEASIPPRCLVPIQPSGKCPPFLCVHDGNGQVLNYRELAHHLGSDQPFYGIQCHGLDGKKVPFIRIDETAAHYIAEIRKIERAGPYFIGGYPFGGRVAYVGLRGRNLAEMAFMATRRKIFAALWNYFERRGREIPRFLRRPVLTNDMIRRAYDAKPYGGTATLFKAELYAWNRPDAHGGWRDLIKGGLEVRPISGRHFEILKPPHVRGLAQELSAALERAQSDVVESVRSLEKISWPRGRSRG